MSCAGCNAPIDCPQDEAFPYSLTGPEAFPFVEDCPTGYNCGTSTSVSLNCCGHILTVQKPSNATQAQLSALFQSLISQCIPFQQECGIVLPPVDSLTNITIYASPAISCNATCPDGLTFTYTAPAGLFIGFTQASATSEAGNYACKQAKLRKLCLSDIIS